MDQLKCVELLIGLAAMLGFVIGLIVEVVRVFGIAHQNGLRALEDGYTACGTQYLPFCF